MTNKILGWFVVGFWIALILISSFENSLNITTFENLQLLGVLGLGVSSIWGAIRLIKLNKI